MLTSKQKEVSKAPSGTKIIRYNIINVHTGKLLLSSRWYKSQEKALNEARSIETKLHYDNQLPF